MDEDGVGRGRRSGGRQRRSVLRRRVRTVELAETSRGQLLTLGTDYAERFVLALCILCNSERKCRYS